MKNLYKFLKTKPVYTAEIEKTTENQVKIKKIK